MGERDLTPLPLRYFAAVPGPCTLGLKISYYISDLRWSYGDSNPRPLACHAETVSRSQSGRVERGASHQQQRPEAVGHSLAEPEHGGSPNWLPGSQGGRGASHGNRNY